MGLPECTLGIIPGAGGTQRAPRLLGRTRAKELIFTGRMVDAREAKEIGTTSLHFALPLRLTYSYSTRSSRLRRERGTNSIRMRTGARGTHEPEWCVPVELLTSRVKL